MTTSDQIIIGSGLSGLTFAYESKQQGNDVVVLESSLRVGGVIRSEKKEGFLLEHGPNSVQPTVELLDLIDSVGLTSQIILANPKLPRFVQVNGQLQVVPMSREQFFSTNLLSGRGKLRVLSEPFRARQKTIGDETLEQFAARRLGHEATEKLVAPFISGIWAGDISKLSAASSFPKLKSWETKYGNLFKGMLSLRREFKNKPTSKKIRGLLSFESGLETLPVALAKSLGENIKTGVLINSISLDRTAKLWTLQTSQGEFQSRKVVVTIPAYRAASLFQSLSLELARTLESIDYAPVAVLHLSISTEDALLPPVGFGFLIAPKENSEMLGCIYSSNLFEQRAPENEILLTVFVGGARHRHAVAKADSELLRLAADVLNPVLGLKRSPQLLNVTRYERAIPQYNVGHAMKEARLRQFETEFFGLKFVGSFLGGISVGDVVRSSIQCAKEF